MLALLTLAALAQVPDGVDVEDLDRWDAGADAFLDGPAGCWELVGHATWEWNFGRFGTSRGDAAFVGRLDDGVWTGFHIESMGEISRRGKQEELWTYNDEPRFAPMFGKLSGGRVTVSGDDGEVVTSRRSNDGTPGNLLRQSLDELSTDVETAYAQWDSSRSGVVYLRVVPLNDRTNAPSTEVSSFFPGGASVPTTMEVAFPEKFTRGTFPRFKVVGARADLRAKTHGSQIFPEAEAVSFEIGVLGFRFSGAQTIQYRSARRCEAPEPDGPQVVSPSPEPLVIEPSPEPAAPVVDREPEASAGPRVITIDGEPDSPITIE